MNEGNHFTPVKRSSKAKAETETDAACRISEPIKICECLSENNRIICHNVKESDFIQITIKQIEPGRCP
jgi:hypothetical protein